MYPKRITHLALQRAAGKRPTGYYNRLVCFIQYLLLQLKVHTIWRLQFLFVLLKTQIPKQAKPARSSA